MSYRSEQDATSWSELLKGWAWLAFTIVIGLWLISAYLTRLFVEHVLDPITNLAFARNDGLLILTSALGWGIIIPALLFPQLAADKSAAPPEEIWRAFVGTLLLGLAWGVSVGVKVVVDLWLEVVDRRQPVYEPQQELGPSVKIVSGPSAYGHRPPPINEELEQDLVDIAEKV
jgi:hypothetical protein